MLLAGCSQVAVKTAHDSTVDFASYKTFNWDPAMESDKANSEEVKSLLASMVKNRVEKEMASKGMKKNASSPDILVGWKGHSEEVSELNIEADPMHYGYGRMRHQTGTISMDSYKVGTLEVFMIDPKMKQVIWSGTADSIIGSGSPSEKLDEAIGGMFKDYPPKK